SFKAAYGAASSAPATVSIIVYPLNDAPNAQPDVATTSKNAAVNIAVRANDTDADGDVLSVSAVTQPANGSVSITGGGAAVNYKPKAGFSGTDAFTYTISDGHGGTATAGVTVTVSKK
ncbi:MAG TPA: Ig-like domain-containing protein, partial [Blastocatellia bacterium]|nr:Ig-like domain-containing protein [Blastocatellia bacterium]